MASDDKKVADATVEKTPGQAAAAADVEASKTEGETLKNFPSVSECAPYHAEIESGLRRLDGIRGKSTHQELLGRCQDKWLWVKANGDYTAPEPDLAKLAKEKAETERLAEKSEWHQDNWNMGRNQHDDEVKTIIAGRKEA